jgi:hypothetical protein
MKPPPCTIRASSRRPIGGAAVMLAATLACAGASAQTAPAKRPAPAPAALPAAPSANDARAPSAKTTDGADSGPLAPFSWLEGCWQGTVNQREFREQWLPLRGGMLIGAGQSVLRGRMQDYEFMRIEPRADGVFFTQFSGDRNETSFKLASTVTEDSDTIFTFTNTADAFPARLVYRRGTGGWLYETIEGSLNGADRKVIYPLRRIDCESGELIRK